MVHGDHWDAIFDDQEQVMDQVLVPLLESGNVVAQARHEIPDESGVPILKTVFALDWPETPLRYMAICATDPAANEPEDDLLHTFFPFCAEGVEVDLRIEGVHADEGDPLEGGVIAYAEHARMVVSLWDPLFFLQRAYYEIGKTYRFILAGLALRLSKAEESAIEMTEGPLVELRRQRAREEDPSADVSAIQSATLHVAADATLLFPVKDFPVWSTFRGPVEAIERFEVTGVPFLRLRTKVVSGEDRSLSIAIYVPVERLEGYEPKIGDGIDGVVWLQGYAIGLGK